MIIKQTIEAGKTTVSRLNEVIAEIPAEYDLLTFADRMIAMSKIQTLTYDYVDLRSAEPIADTPQAVPPTPEPVPEPEVAEEAPTEPEAIADTEEP